MSDLLHEVDQLFSRANFGFGDGKGDSASVDNNETICNVENMMNVVANEKDRPPTGAHGANEAKHFFSFGK